MMEQTAQDINKLGGFCGKRDLPALTQAAMRQAYGCPQADVMVLSAPPELLLTEEGATC